jgi:hypothetical protein
MRDYYVIARKDLLPGSAHSSDWPKIIGYSYQDRCFLLLEGKGHGLMGGELPEAIAKQHKWRDIFVVLDVEWFLDFLEKTPPANESVFVSEVSKKIGSLEILTY